MVKVVPRCSCRTAIVEWCNHDAMTSTSSVAADAVALYTPQPEWTRHLGRVHAQSGAKLSLRRLVDTWHAWPGAAAWSDHAPALCEWCLNGETAEWERVNVDRVLTEVAWIVVGGFKEGRVSDERGPAELNNIVPVPVRRATLEACCGVALPLILRAIRLLQHDVRETFTYRTVPQIWLKRSVQCLESLCGELGRACTDAHVVVKHFLAKVSAMLVPESAEDVALLDEAVRYVGGSLGKDGGGSVSQVHLMRVKAILVVCQYTICYPTVVSGVWAVGRLGHLQSHVLACVHHSDAGDIYRYLEGALDSALRVLQNGSGMGSFARMVATDIKLLRELVHAGEASGTGSQGATTSTRRSDGRDWLVSAHYIDNRVRDIFGIQLMNPFGGVSDTGESGGHDSGESDAAGAMVALLEEQDILLFDKTVDYVRRCVMSVSASFPVLLYGETGVGKTALIVALHKCLGRLFGAKGCQTGSHVVKAAPKLAVIRVSRQLDSRTLIGGYVCGKEPGEFEWRNGILSDALVRGEWLLVEDIDRASQDVLSVILSVLQTGKLNVPGIPGGYVAQPTFRIFATITTDANNSSQSAVTASLLARLDTLFFTIRMDLWKPTALVSVLRRRFPRLDAIAPLLVTTFVKLCGMTGKDAQEKGVSHVARTSAPDALSLKGLRSWGEEDGAALVHTMKRAASECVSEDGMLLVSGGRSRRLSVRDLLKWAARVNISIGSMIEMRVRELKIAMKQDTNVDGAATSNMVLTSDMLDMIILDAVDVFGGSMTQAMRWAVAMSVELFVGARSILNDVSVRCERLMVARATSFGISQDPNHRGKSIASIGRARLSLDVASSILLRRMESNKSHFGHTRSVVRSLERVAVCLSLWEPVLLRGVTGTGKTSIIQHLAELCGRHLVVLNLSSQTELSELFGMHAPVDTSAVVRHYLDEFMAIFPRIVSRSSNQAFLDKIEASWQKGDAAAVVDAMIKGLVAISKRVSSCSPKVAADHGKLLSNVRVYKSNMVATGKASQQVISFLFVEGPLLRAMKLGHWVLLDEINLASAETLEAFVVCSRGFVCGCRN